MESLSWLILTGGGLLSGILAGLLGIGGGVIIVSLLVGLGYPPIQAIATSSLVIILSSTTGSFYNWRMGYLSWQKVIYLAIPAILAAQLGVYLAVNIPPYVLLTVFGVFLLANIFLIRLRKKLITQTRSPKLFNPVVSKLATGTITGVFAGLLGIGGGTIMVSLQMLLLNEEIKVAIRTSLGVIVLTTISACVVHAAEGNILYIQGLILSVGGILGTQVGTRVLPKLPDSFVSQIFIIFLATMAIFNFWQAQISYQGV